MQRYKEHTFKMFHVKHFDELYKTGRKRSHLNLNTLVN